MRRSIRTGLLAALLLGAAASGVRAQETPERRARQEAERRGWLGFAYAAPEDGRLVVIDVMPGSPAERAGLQEQDTVVRWNGRSDVAESAVRQPPAVGDTVRLRVRRGGERDRELALVAEARPRQLVFRRGRSPEGEVIVINPRPLVDELRVYGRGLRIQMDSMAVHADSLHQRLRVMLRDSLGPQLRELERVQLPRVRVEVDELSRVREGFGRGLEVGTRSVAGAEFAPINEGLSDYFGTERGVVVLRVAPETPAARAGLQAGDVVVRANGFAIEGVAELRRAVSRAERRVVELEIVRKGESRKLEMRWE